jgi:uncharacterized protein YlxW (UPF0749 family)
MRFFWPLFFLPTIALAQVPQAAPETEAMSQRIISLTGDAVQWQTKAIELQRKVDELQKQLDAAKKPVEAPAK